MAVKNVTEFHRRLTSMIPSGSMPSGPLSLWTTETHGYLSFQAVLVNDLNELNPLCPRIMRIKRIFCGTKISPLYITTRLHVISFLPNLAWKKKPSPLVLWRAALWRGRHFCYIQSRWSFLHSGEEKTGAGGRFTEETEPQPRRVWPSSRQTPTSSCSMRSDHLALSAMLRRRRQKKLRGFPPRPAPH